MISRALIPGKQMRKFLLPVTALILATAVTIRASGQQKLMSPAEFLGYDLGDRFTPHHRVVDYFRYVGENMPNAEVFSYGETYEHRPLIYMVLTSPENYQRLEEIRLDNLKRAGMIDGQPSVEKIAIVWMSYNVHGNEASSTEASMLTLYELVNPQNTESQQWLKNTVVIIDPCSNPDGRDRYVNFYTQNGNMPPNPAIDGAEHQESWPGGRSNHYYFDLNRDWAWISQVESQKRIQAYNRWLPHVHVDFHEQGYNSPYYFAPAAEPLHEVVSSWQREFQVMIGKNNAMHFDREGWLYFTKEIFDLYYPSYGDTYPTYSGAIGMTYEQAGGGIAGLSITTETGDSLTLKQRIRHHHTSGLSTVEVTSRNAGRVVDEFGKYFRENNTSPSARYKTYVIKADNDPDLINRLTRWMDSHSIRYGHPSTEKATRGFSYQTQTLSPVTVAAEDLIINIFQPKSRFITTVFEPSSTLSDSVTYDITAWNLIYSYNLDAYALTEKINIGAPYNRPPAEYRAPGSPPYAYIFKYHTLEDVSFLAALIQNNVRVRSAEKTFAIDGETFEPGSLIITRRNNEGIYNLDELVLGLSRQFNRRPHTTMTGFVDKGRDFGSAGLHFIKTPAVAVLSGRETSSLSTGEIWHFFERQIHFPVTLIRSEYFKRANINNYNVLVVPAGSYQIFDDETLMQVAAWVSAGGKLILVSDALNAFADKKGFGLHKYATEEEKSQAETRAREENEEKRLRPYGDAERNQVSENISGAIYKIRIDNSHPLGFGMRPTYYTLKTNELHFAFLENGWNVGYLRNEVRPVQGFAGYKANQKLNNSLVFGVEEKGLGEIVYLADNPLFRSFWENGKMLFANAVFMVGQ